MASLVFAIVFLLFYFSGHLIVSTYKSIKRFRLVFDRKRRYHIIYKDPFDGMTVDFTVMLIGTGIAMLFLIPWEIPRCLVMFFYYYSFLRLVNLYNEIPDDSIGITQEQYYTLKRQGATNDEILETYRQS